MGNCLISVSELIQYFSLCTESGGPPEGGHGKWVWTPGGLTCEQHCPGGVQTQSHSGDPHPHGPEYQEERGMEFSGGGRKS